MRSRHFLHLVRKIFHWRAVLIGLHEETSGHIEAKVSKRWIDETTHRYSPERPAGLPLPLDGINVAARLSRELRLSAVFKKSGLSSTLSRSRFGFQATTPRRGIRRQRAHETICRCPPAPIVR